MNKNLKRTGLAALLVGCLLTSFVIPAMAVTPPWMFAKQDESGSGGGDPRVQPSVTCHYDVRATIPLDDLEIVFSYFKTCYPCGKYVAGVPYGASTCNPEEK